MALRLWLPLNGSLINQGLDDVAVTNNGATVNNNGKIGKCYEFDGSNDYISLDSPELYDIIKGGSQAFTITFWIYHADATRAVLFGDYDLPGHINFNIELNTSHAVRFYWSSNPDFAATNTLAALNTWTHIAIAYDGSKIDFYTNGALTFTHSKVLPEKNKTSGMYYLGRDSRTGATALNGRLNDFRIYDEALSPKEVKELAKGLVLHYTLNRGGFGQDNLSINSGDLTLWNKESGITCVWDDTQQMFKIDTTTRTSSRWGIYQDVTCEPNTIYTFSVDGKKVEKTMYLSIGSFASDSVTLPSNRKPFTNNRQRLSYTFTTGDNHTIIRIYLAVYPTSEGSNVAYYALPKLEKGSTATPWIPNSADALYSAMGLDNGIEYDVSGYGNNGSVTGSLAYSSDTPRYLGSTYFNGSSYISTPAGSFNWFDFNQCTVSAWMKPTVKPSSYSGSIGISHNYDNSHKAFAISNHGGNFVAYYNNGSYSSVSSGYTLPLNEWHHCVATLDGTTVTLYVDGVLKKTQTINWGTTPIADTNRVQVAVDFPGSDEKYTGYYSDVRIYATALSADDILTLYNTPISIANNGTLLTQGEISEV